MTKRLHYFYILLLTTLSVTGWSQSEPANHVTGLTATTSGTTSISLSWTGATGSPAPEFYLVVGRKLPAGIFTAVADGPIVPDDPDWSDDNFAANLSFGINNLSVTGLDPASQYEFRVYPYRENAGNANYKTDSPPTTSAFTLSTEPSGHSTTFTATLNGATTIDLAFDAANTLTNAIGYLIYRRVASAVNLTGLTDGSAPPNPLNGATLITTTNASATSYSDIGLQGGVTYHYTIVPFNYNGGDAQTYNYLNNGSAPTASVLTTLIVTLTQISGPGSNIAASPLNSGATNQAILGFSITTNGPTTFNALTVSLTSTASGKFLNPRIFKSADAVFGGDASINTGTLGAQLQFTGISDVLSGAGTTNYFIVVNVEAAVNAATPATQPSFTQASITFTSPAVTPGAATITGIDYSFVDASPPNISFQPANGSINFSTVGNIIITFDEPIRKLDNSPITSTDIESGLVELKENGDAGPTVNFVGSINVTNTIITLNPTATLLPNQVYYVEVNPVEDSNDNATTAQSITFTTENRPSITTFTPTSTCIGNNVTVNGARFTGTGNPVTGNALPTITINGVAIPPANIMPGYTSSSVTFTIPAGATTGPITIRNNDSDLVSTNSATNLTVHPAINTGISVTPTTTNPAQNSSVNITVGTTQDNNYSYQLVLTAAPVGYVPAPEANIGASQTGNNGNRIFNTGTLNLTGTYQFKIRVSRTGCSAQDLTNTVTLNVIALSANAGVDRSICSGQSTLLGGDPPAIGGGGVFTYSWTSTPAGFTSTNPNPIVTPPGTGTITYHLLVTDNFSNTANSSVIVNINPVPAVAFIPSGTDANVRTQFNNTENPYELAASAIPSDGSGVFTGLGVSLFPNGKYYFSPQIAGTANNPITITYTHTSADNCSGSTSMQVNVFASNVIVNNLEPFYCTAGGLSAILSHNPLVIPAGFTYTRMRLFRIGVGYLDIADPVNYPNYFIEIPASNPKTYRLNPALAGIGSYFVDIFATNGVFESLLTWGSTRVFENPAAPGFDPLPSYCVSDNISANRVQVNGTGSINWYNNGGPPPSSPIAGITNPARPTFAELGLDENFAGIFTKHMTQTVNGCESATVPVSITVYANPTPPGISNPAPICSGDPFTNLNATGGGDSFRWYGTLGPNTPDPNTIYTPTVNIVNPTQLLVPNTVVSTQTFQRYVSRFQNGCESPVASVDIVVREKPIAPLAASPTYCLNETITPYSVTTSSPTATVRWYLNPDLTGQINPIADPENATAIDLNISSASAGNYSRYVTQTINFCQSDGRLVATTINPLPSVSISPDITNICKSSEPIRLVASPSGSGASWSGTGAPGLTDIDLTTGQAQLVPSSAIFIPGQAYAITYTFVDGTTNCSNSTTRNFSVFPSINPTLTIGDICDNTFVSITNTSQITPVGALSTIESTGWNFDDGDIITEGIGSLPVPLHGGRTRGSYFDLEHKYTGVGSKTIRYSMTTSDGCTVTAQQTIFVNPVPNVNFSWLNACLGTPTQFNATTNPNLDASIETYTWDFNKTNTLSASIIGTGKMPATTYNSVGRDSVQLIVKTFANCRDTIQKPIFIVPTFDPINSTTSYEQNFNTTADGWINGGSNSSWQFGIPAGAVISRDSSLTGTGNAWVTNRTGLYNPLEKSWVLSQCYSFATNRPVIAMDVWADTPGGIDGAVLQYNLSGDILNDNDWFVIGTVNSGINWYQQQGIASKPGNQSQFDYGWSGNQEDGRYKSWRHVVHKLDELSGGSGVVFRIAFSSTNTGTREGFSFDNVFIGERNRNVLVENFTNSAAPDVVAHNQMFNTFPSGGSSEIIKMQFHTNFPGTDPQNQLFPAINNARTAFYGITSAPTLRIDGLFNPTGVATQWAETLYDNRVLEPSPIRIDIYPPVKDGSIVRINASITNTTSATLSLQGANAFLAIVEKDVNPFINVVRQLLPNAAGILLNHTLDPGESIAIPEVTWSDRNLVSLISGNSAIIVFVQSISAGNQQVLQAQIFDSPVEPDITTSIEDPTFAASIQVYPNPANHEVNVVLPQAARSTVPIVMVDAHGRQIYAGQFGIGEQQKTIATSELSGGLYILRVQAPEGIARKKVMVMHEK
ncbi:MAG: Ig-like domain-containing protein [Cyclobacteriaceae bacterium]|nr:Ig-like domain-containing protein [Cyclobacteriaceae bacterium]UYN85876.1 MAG: Ig-like domain-containing protein [Cyclobacteriaceae bacterium]